MSPWYHKGVFLWFSLVTFLSGKITPAKGRFCLYSVRDEYHEQTVTFFSLISKDVNLTGFTLIQVVLFN